MGNYPYIPSNLCCNTAGTEKTQIVCQEFIPKQTSGDTVTLKGKKYQLKQSGLSSLLNSMKSVNLSQIAQSATQLQFTVLSSSTLQTGKTLQITAQGLDQSLRGRKDGRVYFGCKKHLKQEIVNDFLIPSANKLSDQKHRGRHFVIFYDIPSNGYYIKDLGVGFGTFMKLPELIQLQNNQLFLIADTFLMVKIFEFKIQLKLFSGELFEFQPDQEVRIGRSESCDIVIPNFQSSKVQATLQYAGVSGWIMHDGDKNRLSANGNWMYLNQNQKLSSGMLIKSNHTIFSVTVK